MIGRQARQRIAREAGRVRGALDRATGGRASVALGSAGAAIRVARDEDVPFMAAAIAYYAFVSVLPALLLVFAVSSIVGSDALLDVILGTVGEFLTPVGEDALGDALAGDGGRSGATVAGVVLLVWSALRVFRGLDRAFSRVYGSEREGGFLDELRDALLVLGSIGVGLWAMILLGGVLAAFAPIGGDLLGFVGLLVGLLVVFLPLYYVFPDVELTVPEALPGTAVAAVGWMCLQAGFQMYAAAAPRFELYGVIGGVLLLVTWFYLAAMLLLGGAVVNAVVIGGDRRD